MTKHLLGSTKTMKSPIELFGISSTLTRELVPSTNGKLITYQITLLEIFNHEVKKMEKISYCDYEMAYVAYRCAFELYSKTDKSVNKDILLEIKQTLLRKKGEFELVSKKLSQESDLVEKGPDSLESDSIGGGSSDPLVARFNNLKKDSHESSQESSSLITSESITPKSLKSLNNVLLIDFRESKDFDHNHINHKNVVNIPPSLVSANFTTDLDLEAKLKLHLLEDHYNLFKNRHKFDYVVIYNYKYGFSLPDLADLLVNGDVIFPNPFAKLIELIMFKNKYLSSQLKNFPLYLNGGILAWYETYGPTGITKSEPTNIMPPKATLAKGAEYLEISNTEESPYLKNFGDYLLTAKSKDTSRSSTFKPVISYTSQSTDYVKPKHTSAPSNGILRPTERIPSVGPPAVKNSLKDNIYPSVAPPAVNNSSLKDSHVSSSGPPNQNSSLKDNRMTALKSRGDNSDPTTFLIKYTTGLTNLGNSCYMNSILQCLGATPQLTKFFFPNASSQSYRQHININNKLGTKGILTNSFVKLLIDMFSNNAKSFSPVEFKRVVGSLSPGQQFANYDQQDCNEFLTFLLDSLHEDLNQMVVSNPAEKKAISELTPEEEKMRECLPVRLASTIEWERYLKLNFSVIVDYFQGQYLSQLKCLECQATSTTYNAFTVLSLPIPSKLGNTGNILLDDCLKEFTAVELLDDNNRWRCPNCKRQTKSTKKISITRLPQVLIIHFKRFKLSPQGYFNKLDTFIKYPVKDVLDLTKYWPSVGTSFNPTQGYSKEREQEILSTLPTRNQTPPFRYKLYGVANHYGNLTTGHYTSYVYKESDSKKTRGWCYFDDAKITYNCSENQVLNKNAYCLFYQRI